MHSEETDRRRNIPYIVCDALGLDTSDYSFAYVARWSDGSSEVVKATGERVIGCAKEILAGLRMEVDQPKCDTPLR